MKWISSASDDPQLGTAIQDCITVINDSLNSKEKPSLIVIFVSAHYHEEKDSVLNILKESFSESVIFGCSAAGIVGSGKEYQNRPSVTIMAAILPSVSIVPFYTAGNAIPSADDPPESWKQFLGIAHLEKPDFILLAEPFYPHINQFLAGIDYAFPHSVKIGGLTSGGTQPGTNHLFSNASVYTQGLIGLALEGNLKVEPVVAQGCRPIGDPKQITKCQENILLGIDGETPLDYLNRLYQKLSSHEQGLFKNQLLIGIGTSSVFYSDQENNTEFLIRNIMGADPEKGILAIGELIREGQIVQFHIRDAVSSANDLQAQLVKHTESPTVSGNPEAAMMFQCTGRGSYLYGEEGHDSRMFTEIMGSIPLSGFFCNGEIGPVGDTTYLHGYTASIALFHKKID